jgi:selenocysteine-specific elongation factor
MIAATAGHIDHGKTRLVRAMTGIDTDRLPEEKARGISIDPGFAHWQLPTGTRFGFFDVPGHERFVRSMLAGVCGIDYALLIVAADDGVIPQTIEHVQILDLLGIRKGIAAITKTDRVSAARIGEVRDDVAALLAGTSLSAVSILPVSTVSGEDLDVLKDTLAAAADTHSTKVDEDRHFRLAIDRAFTIGGSGTVVTGTVFSGEVTVGARLCLGITLRVGAARRMPHDAVAILGEASPVVVGAAAGQAASVKPAPGKHPAHPSSVHRSRASS